MKMFPLPRPQIQPALYALIEPHLAGMTDDVRRFFAVLFDPSRTYIRAWPAAQAIGIKRATVITRFARLELPTLKAVVAGVLLVRAAREVRYRTYEQAALELGSSGPSNLDRALRSYTGIGLYRLRSLFPTDEAAIAWFVDRYVTPYADRWPAATIPTRPRATTRTKEAA